MDCLKSITSRTAPSHMHPVAACIQAIAVRDASGVKPELIGGRRRDLFCFLMVAGSALMPVMVVYWSEGGQRISYSQTVCGLDTLDLHMIWRKNFLWQ
ncbi:hypothetical protein TNCV_4542731 [Trichonephila clavipes]|nr:hypothetical protein TNCV_4542731 [Trichonephila clavipes]